MTTVILIEGDGIGPEVVTAARRCLDATEADIEFVEAAMGESAIEDYGTPLPDETVEAVDEVGIALKGPVKTPVGSGFRSVNVALRKELELYANVRPCKYIPGVDSRLKEPEDIDLVVVRENLEDVYAGIEFEQGEDGANDMHRFLRGKGSDTRGDSAYSIKPISRSGSERIIRHAFEYADEHDRGSVTVVDKANIMKYTDGMFMDIGEEVAEDYGVKHNHLLVDNMAQQLVLHPERFDVIVTQNLYGDILSDLTAGLVGGVGVVPSANMGEDTAVFASVHGTAPDIAGENKANPTALIRSAIMLLRHIGEDREAVRLRNALYEVLKEGEHVTHDLGGPASTERMTQAVIDKLNGEDEDDEPETEEEMKHEIRSAISLLEGIGEREEASRLRNALFDVLEEGKHDSTEAMTQAVIDRFKQEDDEAGHRPDETADVQETADNDRDVDENDDGAEDAG